MQLWGKAHMVAGTQGRGSGRACVKGVGSLLHGNKGCKGYRTVRVQPGRQGQGGTIPHTYTIIQGPPRQAQGQEGGRPRQAQQAGMGAWAYNKVPWVRLGKVKGRQQEPRREGIQYRDRVAGMYMHANLLTS